MVAVVATAAVLLNLPPEPEPITSDTGHGLTPFDDVPTPAPGTTPAPTTAAPQAGTAAAELAPVPVAPLVEGLSFADAECVRNPEPPVVHSCAREDELLSVHYHGSPTAPRWIFVSLITENHEERLDPVLAELSPVWGPEAAARIRAVPHTGELVRIQVPWGTLFASRSPDEESVLTVTGTAVGGRQLLTRRVASLVDEPAVRQVAERQGWQCHNPPPRGTECTKGPEFLRIVTADETSMSFRGPDHVASATAVLQELPDGPALLATLRGIPEDRFLTVHDSWLVERHPTSVSFLQNNWRYAP